MDKLRMVLHENSGSADFRRCSAHLSSFTFAVVAVLSACLVTSSLGGKDKELRLTGGENKCSGRVEVLDAFGWIMFLVEGMSQLSGTANMMDGESITVLTNRMLE